MYDYVADLVVLVDLCAQKGLRAVVHSRVLSLVPEPPTGITIAETTDDASFVHLGLFDPSIVLVGFGTTHPAAGWELRPRTMTALERAGRVCAVFKAPKDSAGWIDLSGPRDLRSAAIRIQDGLLRLDAGPDETDVGGDGFWTPDEAWTAYTSDEKARRAERARAAQIKADEAAVAGQAEDERWERYEVEQSEASANRLARYGTSLIRIAQPDDVGGIRVTEYRQLVDGTVLVAYLKDDDCDLNDDELEDDDVTSLAVCTNLRAAVSEHFDPCPDRTDDGMQITLMCDRQSFLEALESAVGSDLVFFHMDGVPMGFDGTELLDRCLILEDVSEAEDLLRSVWKFQVGVDSGGPWTREVSEMVGERNGSFFYIEAGDTEGRVVKLGRFSTDAAALKAGKHQSPRTDKDRRQLLAGELRESGN